jgi:nucleotide-binding universal stress UspA family protein
MSVVVGVEGSPDSLVAMQWAHEEARLRGCRLEIVHAYWGGDEDQRRTERMRARAEEILQGARVALGDPGDVPTSTRAVTGVSAAQALLDAAKDAELLVVGSRGLGGFAGLLVGSVSRQCAEHAPCPVTIVPSKRRRRD